MDSLHIACRNGAFIKAIANTEESVHRIWRLWYDLKLGLPKRRPRRRRTGSDIRLPGVTQPNAVWSYDFVEDRTASGSKLRLLTVIDEYTRECLAIEVGRYLRSQDVILTLSRLMRLYGKPTHIHSDNSAEFTATAVMKWLREAKIIIEHWRHFYDHERPHFSLGYRPPALVANRALQSHA